MSNKRKGIFIDPVDTNLPRGVQTTQNERTQIIPGALKLSDRLSFSDYSRTNMAFNVQENAHISYPEKILMDNIWVAHNNSNKAHMIANLNGLGLYFQNMKKNNKKYYVLFKAAVDCQLGIYPNIEYILNLKDPKFKVCNNLSEAIKEAHIYCQGPIYVDPELKDEAMKHFNKRETSADPAEINGSIKKIKQENVALKKAMVSYKKTVVDKDEEIALLKSRIEQIQKKAPKVSKFSLATHRKPISFEDKMMKKMDQLLDAQADTHRSL